MSKFTEKVIEKIRQDGIEPEAGWIFTAKRSFLWIGIVLSGGLAALSLSMIAFSILSIDRSPLTIAPDRLFSSALFRSFPFFWIGLLAAFSTLAVIEFRNTRHGYRHRMATVAVISGTILVVGASIFSAWGADERAERAMRNGFPRYAELSASRERFWLQPKEGFLAGEIDDIHDFGFSLSAFDGTKWQVETDAKTTIRPAVKIAPHEKVKIIGDIDENDRFKAEDIRPWERPKNHAPKGRTEEFKGRDENIRDRMRSNE